MVRDVAVAGASTRSVGAVPTMLRTPPAGGPVLPPVVTKADYLPLGELGWADVERLFLRLAEREGRAEYAELYGTAGQGQEGIDLVVRNARAGGGSGGSSARRYTTLQSKAVKSLTASKIKSAVDKFVTGSWADRSEVFIYATTHELRPTQLVEELDKQADRLERLGVRLERWGRERVSELMRPLPELVDDFFGREWVKEFCGSDVAASLEGRLQGRDVVTLRAGLRDLYRASFAVQDTGSSLLVPSVAGAPIDPPGFVTLDIAEGGSDPLLGSRTDGAAGRGEQDGSDPARTEALASGAGGGRLGRAGVVAGERFGDTGRMVAPLDGLLQRGRLEDDLGAADISRVPVDEWLAGGMLSVVAGPPGAGKSSLLRHVVLDLLEDAPSSAALADRFGSRVPVWLPFPFLCEHIREGTDRSVGSAVRTWLTRHSAQHLHALVDQALEDDRLLLVVDGLDEWTDEESAHPALSLLETFVRSRSVAAVVSSRPYALRRLVTLAGWRVGHMAPLSAQQRRQLAAMAFAASGRVPQAASGVATGAPAVPDAARVTADDLVDRFCDELGAVAELEVLARVPLFLLMLVGLWSGGPLPAKRVHAYERLVDLLVERHPAIRRRASPRPGPGVDTAEMRQILAAVAYRLRSREAGFVADAGVWRSAVVEVLCDEQLLGYEVHEARRRAPQILAAGEGDLGVLVSYGAGSVGFAHRAVAEQLVAEHLLGLPFPQQEKVLRARVGDRSWREVLLALLAGQQRANEVAALLDIAVAAGPENSMPLLGGYELAAEALASGVRLSPRDVGRFCDLLCRRVERHPWMPHRARLLSSLTGALADTTARRSLMPWFSQKILGRTQSPGAWYELHNTGIPAEQAEPALLAGIRHPASRVKDAAARALAERFGGSPEMRDDLAALVLGAADARTQGAALQTLTTGWPAEPLTTELIAWGRRQRAAKIRAVAIRAARESSQSSDADGGAAPWVQEERQWLLSVLDHGSRQVLPQDSALVEMVCEAAEGDAEVRDRCLSLVSGFPGSPGPQGFTALAWRLLPVTFGSDPKVIDWMVAALASKEHLPDRLTAAPDRWAEEPAIRDAAYRRLQRDRAGVWESVDLVRLSPTEQTRDHMITLLDREAWQSEQAAFALQKHFAQDPVARQALRRRIGGPADKAAALAWIAADVLGPVAGMERLTDLLREHSGEDRSTVVSAIGRLWRSCHEGTTESTHASLDRTEAARVLEQYSGRDLALQCLDAVPTEGYGTARGWIIGTWPEVPEVLTYARKALTGPEPEVSGVLYGYGPHGGPTAAQIVADATALLSPLEPELRVVAAQQLARRGIDTDLVIDLLGDWKSDTSPAVRRAAATTLARALAPQRGQAVDGSPPERRQEALERLRRECRTDLAASWTAEDHERRTAWVIMLLLGDVTLLDGLVEGRDRSPVSVKLSARPLTATDSQFSELIAANWTVLQRQCNNQLIDRFSSRSARRDPARPAVWSALAPVARRHPDVERALQDAVLAHPELLRDRRVLAWYSESNPSDPRLLDLAAQAADMGRSVGSAADAFLDQVSAPTNAQAHRDLLTLLVQQPGHGRVPALINDEEIGFHISGWRRVALARLLPDDPHAQSLYRWLGAVLESGEGIDWTWEEACAVTIGLAPAAHLPILILRLSARLHRRGENYYAPDLVEAVVHRLRRDPAAEVALVAAIIHPDGIDASTGMWQAPDTVGDTSPAHQQILLAALLLAATGLPPAVTEALAPLTSADATLADNPLMTPRPVALAVLDLLDAAT
ncbi:NACHT domain-containing protein [Kitasatospora sp. NPDC057015]|uniref:NACHT domain-containing protein n=1 Tax=Kitasatospora sp. NPDC057015 TaxID=3346001 RepID=UPI003635E9F2